MSRTHWLLTLTPPGGRLERIGAKPVCSDLALPPDAGPGEVAHAVRQSLEQHGYRREPLVIAVPSQACLAATFPHTGRPMTRNRQAMAYALEEYLPLAAEETVCDFVAFDADALGVAVAAASLEPLLAALEKLEIPVASIVPASLLGLQYQVEKGSTKGRRLAVLQHDDTLDLIELIDGRPHAWRSISARPETLIREIKAFEFDDGHAEADELLAWLSSDELLDVVHRVAGETRVQDDRQSLSQSAGEASAAILSGHQRPWIELRRGSFGNYDPYRAVRGRLRILATVVAFALFVLSAAMWVRAEKLRELAREFRQPQEDVFEGLFPGQSVPVGIRSRLESEYRKLAGTAGNLEGTPRLKSSSALLRDALLPLPVDLRYRLLEIRLEDDQVTLDGEVRRHGDADLLATALRNNGFQVESPRTESLADKGVSITIAARRPAGQGTGTSEEDAPSKEEGPP